MTNNYPPDAGGGTRTPSQPLFDSQTHAHLLTSYQQDAQASRLSERLARLAEIEGFPDIARTFREISETQSFLAQGHLDLLMRAADPISSMSLGETSQNLRAAIAGHRGELLDGLHDKAQVARSEGFHDIASWFDNLRSTREHHLQRLTDLLGPERGTQATAAPAVEAGTGQGVA